MNSINWRQFYFLHGTQAEVEATTGVGEWSVAFATDRASGQKLGYYNGTSWEWMSGGGGGGGTWGSITGTLADQTDLQTALDAKVDENAAITGATKTKITYDAKGLVTAGADATQDDIGDGTTYKQYSATDKTKLAGVEAGADVTDIGNVGAALSSAAAASVDDSDEFHFWQIAGSVIKKITWANIKAALVTYFDTLYAALIHTHAAGDVVSGTLDAARLPAPTTTALGGVKRNTGTAGQYVTGIDTGGALTYDTPAGGGITWSVVTTDGALTVNAGHLVDSASLVTFTLPTSAAVGDIIEVAGINSGGWQINGTYSKSIIFGVLSSYAAPGGYIASTHERDSIRMICIATDNTWQILSAVGNIEVV